MIDVNGRIRDAIVRRAMHLKYAPVYDLLDGRPFILAGGALSGDPVHDYDIYPDSDDPYSLDTVMQNITSCKDAELLASTRNALTVRIKGGQVVQLCSYLRASIGELVESFDFSHVQAGIRFPGSRGTPNADDVYYTDGFVVANVTRQTEYTGSEYPTSSLVRTLKYYKRGKITKGVAGRMLLLIMADVLKRGFADYADFKDQIDAIDLGLPDCDEARALYKAACDAKLVKEER